MSMLHIGNWKKEVKLFALGDMADQQQQLPAAFILWNTFLTMRNLNEFESCLIYSDALKGLQYCHSPVMVQIKDVQLHPPLNCVVRTQWTVYHWKLWFWPLPHTLFSKPLVRSCLMRMWEVFWTTISQPEGNLGEGGIFQGTCAVSPGDSPGGLFCKYHWVNEEGQ